MQNTTGLPDNVLTRVSEIDRQIQGDQHPFITVEQAINGNFSKSWMPRMEPADFDTALSNLQGKDAIGKAQYECALADLETAKTRFDGIPQAQANVDNKYHIMMTDRGKLVQFLMYVQVARKADVVAKQALLQDEKLNLLLQARLEQRSTV